MTTADAIEQAVAGRLKVLRQRARLSRVDLAERMSGKGHPWHETTAYKIESGRRNVRVGELADLAAILGVTPAVLLSDDDHEEAVAVRDVIERALRQQMAAEILSGNRDSGQVPA